MFAEIMSKNIYIPPLGILLMERHTEIEHGVRPAQFLRLYIVLSNNSITIFQHNQTFPFQGPRYPKLTVLIANSLLEELTVTELIWL
jgi:hypothetical protein